MGFIKLGSGHVIHASQLPDLNPPGSIELTALNEKTGKWEVIVEKARSFAKGGFVSNPDVAAGSNVDRGPFNPEVVITGSTKVSGPELRKLLDFIATIPHPKSVALDLVRDRMKKDLPAKLVAECDSDPDLFAVVVGVLWITAVRIAKSKDAEIYELIKDIKVEDIIPDFKGAVERWKEKNADHLQKANLRSV